jgi:hypothetical protein
MTRSGAPFQGAIGVGSTLISPAFPHAADAVSALESTAEKSSMKKAPAIGNKVVLAAVDRCGRSILSNLLEAL